MDIKEDIKADVNNMVKSYFRVKKFVDLLDKKIDSIDLIELLILFEEKFKKRIDLENIMNKEKDIISVNNLLKIFYSYMVQIP